MGEITYKFPEFKSQFKTQKETEHREHRKALETARELEKDPRENHVFCFIVNCEPR